MRIRVVLVMLFLGVFPQIQNSWASSTGLIAIESCSKTDAIPCIESFSALDDAGIKFVGQQVGSSRKYALNYAGQSTSVVDNYEWVIDGAKNENGSNRYLLEVMYFPLEATYCAQSICGTGTDEVIIQLHGSSWGGSHAPVDYPDWPAVKSCGLKESPSYCYRSWGADGSLRYEVKLKMPKNFEFSHANGEALDGNISEDTSSERFNVLTFNAKPVPLSFVWWSEFDPQSVFTQERADETMNHWNAYIQSSRSLQSSWLKNCNFGKGMSLWYSSNLTALPAWNDEDQTLSLGVASTHFRVDGSLNIGAFNINMPLETAKCLWNVDLSQKVSTQVSVTYGSGSLPDIVTASSSINGNYFKLKVSGFHFSAPAFKISLKQDPVQQIVKNEIVEVTKTRAISCKKGKLIKKITSPNPSCPKGYRQMK